MSPLTLRFISAVVIAALIGIATLLVLTTTETVRTQESLLPPSSATQKTAVEAILTFARVNNDGIITMRFEEGNFNILPTPQYESNAALNGLPTFIGFNQTEIYRYIIVPNDDDTDNPYNVTTLENDGFGDTIEGTKGLLTSSLTNRQELFENAPGNFDNTRLLNYHAPSRKLVWGFDKQVNVTSGLDTDTISTQAASLHTLETELSAPAFVWTQLPSALDDNSFAELIAVGSAANTSSLSDSITSTNVGDGDRFAMRVALVDTTDDDTVITVFNVARNNTVTTLGAIVRTRGNIGTRRIYVQGSHVLLGERLANDIGANDFEYTMYTLSKNNAGIYEDSGLVFPSTRFAALSQGGDYILRVLTNTITLTRISSNGEISTKDLNLPQDNDGEIDITKNTIWYIDPEFLLFSTIVDTTLYWISINQRESVWVFDANFVTFSLDINVVGTPKTLQHMIVEQKLYVFLTNTLGTTSILVADLQNVETTINL